MNLIICLNSVAGFSPFPIGRGYGQIAHPGFIPLNPYPLAQSMFYNGWPYYRQAAPAACGKGAITATDNYSLNAAKNTWTFIVSYSLISNWNYVD